MAEPLAGVVDTAFVRQLGAAPLSALGAATIVLSGSFWAFNFLGIGTQTEVAHGLGAGDSQRAGGTVRLSLWVAATLGCLLALIAWPCAPWIADAMNAEGDVQDGVVVYLRIRLLGAPATLLLTAAFGALRGAQAMRTPLWIAAALSALNVALDAWWIFGGLGVPAMGLAGAAWATTASQWAGALAAIVCARRHFAGGTWVLRDALRLLAVGRDLFLRTGLLMLFLVAGARVATRLGETQGAAHQAIRQVWMLSAFALDAFAATAQSLVGYFLGAGRVADARRVARLACGWAFGSGVALAVVLSASTPWAARWLVPESAHGVFVGAWLTSAVAQPLNALSFVTDGIHWATRDWRFLRNAMAIATGAGFCALQFWDVASSSLTAVWIVTGAWITLRAGAGVLRAFPGWGTAPLSRRADEA